MHKELGGKEERAAEHCAGHCWAGRPAGAQLGGRWGPSQPQGLAVGSRGEGLPEPQRVARGGTADQCPPEHQTHTFMKSGEPYFEEIE